VAKCTGPRGAANVFSDFQIGGKQEKQKIVKAENRVGCSKNVPLNKRKNARPGNLRLGKCAGLLMERFVKVRFIKIGKKK
jgi:hypothetical protein